MSVIYIQCSDCGEEFEWTDGEQRFMERLKNEGKIKEVNKPRRCPDCRQKRKQQNQKSDNQ